MLSPAVDNLVAQLTRLPGIGTRTAQRLAFHLLAAPTDEANALGLAIADVKARVRACPACGNLTEEELCGVCAVRVPIPGSRVSCATRLSTAGLSTPSR